MSLNRLSRVKLELSELDGRDMPSNTPTNPVIPQVQVVAPPASEPVYNETVAIELAAYFEAGGTVELLNGLRDLNTGLFVASTTLVLPNVGGVTLEYRPGTGGGSMTLIMPVESGSVPVNFGPATVAYVSTLKHGLNDEGPLSKIDARYLKLLLDALAKDGKLSTAQLAELKKLIERFNKHGLKSEGVEQIKLLQELIDALGKVAEKAKIEAVNKQLDYISKMIEQILVGLQKVKNNEYEKFKQLMGENSTLEEARKRMELLRNGFTDWVEEHWLRYQLEILKEKIDKAKK